MTRRILLLLALLCLAAPACHRPRMHCGISWGL